VLKVAELLVMIYNLSWSYLDPHWPLAEISLPTKNKYTVEAYVWFGGVNGISKSEF
jgi:hypothetical protein